MKAQCESPTWTQWIDKKINWSPFKNRRFCFMGIDWVFKKIVLVVAIISFFAGCSITKQHEKEVQQKATEAGLTAVEKSRFDGTFMVPGTSFAQYKKLLVEQLDMSQVNIREPSTSYGTSRTPWELNQKDRLYYQDVYTQALMENLIIDGRFATAIESGRDVLRIKAKVLEIAPLASKDDAKGRPTQQTVFSYGMGTMTLEISLYDSTTDKLLGIISDQRDLGTLWEENNRATNSRQVRLAFNAWLSKLRSELDALSY